MLMNTHAFGYSTIGTRQNVRRSAKRVPYLLISQVGLELNTSAQLLAEALMSLGDEETAETTYRLRRVVSDVGRRPWGGCSQRSGHRQLSDAVPCSQGLWDGPIRLDMLTCERPMRP